MAEQVARELKLQMFVSHPNVVKVYGYFDDLLHFYIIMECALDGHLSDLLARRPAALPEEEAAVLFHQTCSAVSVLHRHSIIHRDLKPENLLMHEVPPSLPRESSRSPTSAGACSAGQASGPPSAALRST